MSQARRPTAEAFLLGALLLLEPTAVSAQAPPTKPSFPAQADVVTVDVVVTGHGNAPVLDLRREDFSVSEDGVPQEVVAFEAVSRPAAAPPPEGKKPVPEPRTSSNLREPGREAASFVVVFDELHLDPAEAARARKAVEEFLVTTVATGDRVALVGTHEGTRWTARMPEGRDAILQVLARMQGRRVGQTVKDAMTDYEAMRIDQDRDPVTTDQVMRRLIQTGYIQKEWTQPGERYDEGQYIDGWRGQTRALAGQVYARAAGQLEQSLGIVDRAVAGLAGSPGRKSLVLVTGGLVRDVRLSSYRRVVTDSLRANVAIYSLDARGIVAATSGLSAEVNEPLRTQDASMGVGLTEGRERSEGSESLALDTGGVVLKQNDLAGGLARIAEDSRSYYLLGYAPASRPADGRFHEIQVKVAREGVRVRARRGYYAPGRSEKAAKAEARDAGIQRALDAPFDLSDVPVRALAQVLGEPEPGKAAVMLTAEVDIRGLAFTERDQTSRDTLETLLLVARRDTGEFTRFDQQFEMAFKPETRTRIESTWFPVTRELTLSPGPYQAKIVARDRNSGRVGSVSHDFEVPALAGLRVSSLALSDRLHEAGAAGGRAPEPTARRAFPPAGVLHCRFEVYGAAKDPKTGQPRVTAGLAIRRGDGRVLVAMPETPLQPGPDGTLARALGTPLGGVPAGTYEVIVVVTDLAAGQAAEARDAFVVEGNEPGR
jgi:VWFA-related protein